MWAQVQVLCRCVNTNVLCGNPCVCGYGCRCIVGVWMKVCYAAVRVCVGTGPNALYVCGCKCAARQSVCMWAQVQVHCRCVDVSVLHGNSCVCGHRCRCFVGVWL